MSNINNVNIVTPLSSPGNLQSEGVPNPVVHSNSSINNVYHTPVQTNEPAQTPGINQECADATIREGGRLPKIDITFPEAGKEPSYFGKRKYDDDDLPPPPMMVTG